MSVRTYNLAERVLGRSLAWRLGRWLYMGSRRELQNDPAVNGEYELQRAWLQACANAGRSITVVDVGANIGDWSAKLFVELRRAEAGAAEVWAFEPALAQRNAMASRLSGHVSEGSLHIDDRAIGAAPGRATFVLTGTETGTSALATEKAAASGVQVEVTSLDVVFSDGRRLDLVKVDTEGNDFNVILGARNLFDHERIGVLQFEYNWRWVAFRYFLKDVFDFVEGRPYRIGRVTPAGIEIYSGWHHELERFIETNYVLVHDELLSALPHSLVEFGGGNIPIAQRPANQPLT